MELLKTFYMVHYNFGAVLALMFLLGIFFAVKKNIKGILILVILMAVINVVVYQKTNNKAWTRDFYMSDEYKEKFPLYMKIVKEPATETFTDSMSFTFTALDERYPWVVVDANEKSEKIFHWCWVEDAWESFASVSLVDKLWGSKQAHSVRKSSENRIGDLKDQ